MQIQSFINIRQNPKADFYFGLLAVNFIALGYLFGFLNPGDLDTDGGTFAAVAFKDMNGGVLYNDTWDHKPPGIYYLIELFFFFIPNKIYALYALAIVGVLGIVNGLYFNIKYLVNSLLLTILLLLLFIYFALNSLYLGDGLYTEIFGSVCMLWGLYFYNLFHNDKKVKFAYLAIIFTTFSIWFKEPFILILLPIFIALISKINYTKSIIKFLVFAAIPSIGFFILLLFNGSFTYFIDTVQYNFLYASTDNKVTNREQLYALWQNILNPLFLLLAIIVIYAWRCFLIKEARSVLIFHIFLMMGGVAFVLISPNNFNHYYLPFIIIFFYCLASLINIERKHFKSSLFIIYIMLFYCIKKTDDIQIRKFSFDIQPYEVDHITAIISKDASKTLFIDLVDAAEFYIKGEKVFPVFMAVPVAAHFGENEVGLKNRKRMYEELKSKRPDFLITGESSSYMYWHFPDPMLYYGNFEKIDSMDTRYNKRVYLWQRK